jgi:DNA-binding CsgD family transcriptional regulator
LLTVPKKIVLVFLYALCFSWFAFADTIDVSQGLPAAARIENNGVFYYATLHSAFEAAGGSSPDNPDEITLLADVVLDEPIMIESGKHIALVAGNGERTITRGGNVDFPLFWFRGDDASFILGKPDGDGEAAQDSLTIDGGYLNEPSIEARAPLIAINGQRSKMMMYGGVTLQNNYNHGSADGTDIYTHGAGVLLRTDEGGPENMSEFIMKGGTIRGNINNAQTPYPSGGGVFIFAFGLFTMEGGAILDNTVYRFGGGVAVAGRGSFKKTGGVIYGADADEGLRNTVIDDTGAYAVYGHAVCVALTESQSYHFRDDTVGEDEMVSYSGSVAGIGVFGEGEHWERPGDEGRRFFLIGLAAVLATGGVVVFFFLRTSRKRQGAVSTEGGPDPALLEIARNLSPREKEAFDLLLTGRSLRAIADELAISYSGLKFHTQKIYRKFGIQSRTELLVLFHKTTP